MDIFAKQFPSMFPFQNMEGNSVQIQAEYADRDPNNSRIQTASLNINLQTLKVNNGSPGSNNTNDDVDMSGLDHPVGGIINDLNNRNTRRKQYSSINTGQIDQQAEMARMLQPTIRALQSATDKAINKSKKIASQGEVFIGPRLPSGRKTSRPIPESVSSRARHENSAEKKRKRKETNKTIINAPNTKPKTEKNKKNCGDNTKAKLSEGVVKKRKTRKPKEGKVDHMEYLMERRKLGDKNALAAADKTARSNADEKVDIYGHGLNPADWETVYQQEYQARTARLRERQARDEQALMSALNGLSLDVARIGGGNYDLIL
ncbi:uncharacterized protein Bfra_004697 [Botrytis fragariae]|uniref:Uncharacterized protein n=1 Tax=Botrytis fragariae TaxID=1964551 RepID=A0A8H6EJM4_9HELO|nr:uncharacterized protein Bfra_004697 [Botrytis fragariae]KAF5874682.1 hypothetical protein Bfra_004697 [Botrytis fragariae]